MVQYKDMPEILSDGEVRSAKLEHFIIDKNNLRAIIHDKIPVPSSYI